MIRNILFLIAFIFAVLTSTAQAVPASEAKTTSGIPANSDLIITFKRICVAKSVPPSVTKWPLTPKIEIGTFRAEFDTETKAIRKNLQPLENFSQVPFVDKAKSVNKRSNGSKEYGFDSYPIKIPFEEIEKSIVQINQPKIHNRLQKFLDRASNANRPDPLKLGGFYIKVDGVRSLVAFDGTNTNISTNLRQKEKDGSMLFEKLFPLVATWTGTKRDLRAQGSAHVSHLDPPLECNGRSNFEYSVEVIPREES